MSRSIRSKSVLIALLLGISPTLLGQQSGGLNVELIDQRIAALKDAGAAEDDQTLQAYSQAKVFLNQAEAFSGEEAGYVDALTSAPRQQAEIQADIDRLDKAYDPASEVADFTPQEVTTRLALVRAEQSDLNAQIDRLDVRLSARETTATDIRARLLEISQRASTLPGAALTVNRTAAPSLAEANQWRDRAEALSLGAERRAREAELASQPPRYALMTAQRAELASKAQRLTSLAELLETLNIDNVQPVVDISELGIAETDPAYSVAKTLIDNAEELRDEQISLNQRLAESRQQMDEIDRVTKILDDRFATARRITDFAGDSDAQGKVLLTYWEEIDTFTLTDTSRQRSQEAGSAVIRRIGHEEALYHLISASRFLEQRFSEADIDPDSIEPATLSILMDLTRDYRQRLRTVIADESDYIDSARALQSGYSSLEEKVREYRRFLEGRILWIANHPPLWKIDSASVGATKNHILANIESLEFKPATGSMAALLAALVLLLSRRRLFGLQKDLGGKILRPREDSIRFTLFALGTAALRAAPAPLMLLGLARGFDAAGSPAGEYMTQLFSNLALLLFYTALMRIVVEPSGIGRVHFSWRATTTERVYRQLTFMIRWWIPLAAIAALANRLAPTTGHEAAARALILLALLIPVYRLGRDQIREIRAAGRAWFGEALNQLRLLLTAALAMLIIQTVYGQVFTVTVVAQCMMETVWIGISLLLIYALLLRWLRVAQRHLRLNEFLAKRQGQPASEDGVSTEEQVPDLGDISTETRQLVTASVLATAAVALLYTWSPLLPAFEALRRVVLWTSTSMVEGEAVTNQITLATLFTIAALAGLTLFTAKKLPAVIEIILRSRTSISPGARYTVSTLLNYLIIGTGVIAALSALGLQWGQLQWLVAALGVGIGFGLQEIVANFISGLIILFERPIRVGDIVSIGDKDGTVTKIRIRATTIRDWDGKELLVPNKEFITGRLLNWTLSDSDTRITIDVGIAYGSNVEQALEILRDVALNHPRTVREPPPLIVFENFGDNALELSSRSFIDSLDGRLQVMTEMRQEINRRFEEAGIVIAFPQRDVHVETQGPIRVAIDPSPDSPAKG